MQKMYALLRRILEILSKWFWIYEEYDEEMVFEDGLGEVRFSNLRFRIDLEVLK